MNTNEEMLEFLYKSASMSVDTTARVLKKTRDGALRRELSSQINGYKQFADNATRELKNHGMTPQDNGTMTKLMTNMGIEFNTMVDSTSSHIAELMINGTNMGIIKLNKHLNRNKDLKAETTAMCQNLIAYQKSNINKLEPYLS